MVSGNFSDKPKFHIFGNFFHHFLWHISFPARVFPWFIWADIKPKQSSNKVFKLFLRLSWSVKYIYQKYRVKGCKKCNSAGSPKTSQRPAERWRWRRVLRTMWRICLKKLSFSSKIIDFWRKFWFRIIFQISQNFTFFAIFFIIFCDTFPFRFESSRGPFELILSQIKALI